MRPIMTRWRVAKKWMSLALTIVPFLIFFLFVVERIARPGNLITGLLNLLFLFGLAMWRLRVWQRSQEDTNSQSPKP